MARPDSLILQGTADPELCSRCGSRQAPALRLLLLCTRKEQVSATNESGHFPHERHDVKLQGPVGNRPFLRLEDLAPEWAAMFRPGFCYEVEIRATPNR